MKLVLLLILFGVFISPQPPGHYLFNENTDEACIRRIIAEEEAAWNQGAPGGIAHG
jgi:hypothetical protein